MSEDRNAAVGIDPSRHLNLALAALRDAAEHLEDAVAASENPNLGVVSALTHVGAARKALRPHGFGAGTATSEQDAA